MYCNVCVPPPVVFLRAYTFPFRSRMDSPPPRPTLCVYISESTYCPLCKQHSRRNTEYLCFYPCPTTCTTPFLPGFLYTSMFPVHLRTCPQSFFPSCILLSTLVACRYRVLIPSLQATGSTTTRPSRRRCARCTLSCRRGTRATLA